MTLHAVQSELARILLEADASRKFAHDPASYLRARGVQGRDLDLLAALDADDLAYFASRRNIDRIVALRADAPLATDALRRTKGNLNRYFRAFPYSLEDPRLEIQRFASWARKVAARGGIQPIVADLAAYEAEVQALLATQARKARPSKHPRIAPGVRLLHLETSIADVLLERPARASPAGPASMALHRTATEVLWFVLDPLDVALLDSADGATPQKQWITAAANRTSSSPAQAREAFAVLAAQDLLAPLTTAAP